MIPYTHMGIVANPLVVRIFINSTLTPRHNGWAERWPIWETDWHRGLAVAQAMVQARSRILSSNAVIEWACLGSVTPPYWEQTVVTDPLTPLPQWGPAALDVQGILFNWFNEGGEYTVHLLRAVEAAQIAAKRWIYADVPLPPAPPPLPANLATAPKLLLWQNTLATFRQYISTQQPMSDGHHGPGTGYWVDTFDQVCYRKVGSRYWGRPWRRMSWEAFPYTTAPQFSPCGCVVTVNRESYIIPCRFGENWSLRRIHYYVAKPGATVMTFRTPFCCWNRSKEYTYFGGVGEARKFKKADWTSGAEYGNAPGVIWTGPRRYFEGWAPEPPIPTPADMQPTCDVPPIYHPPQHRWPGQPPIVALPRRGTLAITGKPRARVIAVAPVPLHPAAASVPGIGLPPPRTLPRVIMLTPRVIAKPPVPILTHGKRLAVAGPKPRGTLPHAGLTPLPIRVPAKAPVTILKYTQVPKVTMPMMPGTFPVVGMPPLPPRVPAGPPVILHRPKHPIRHDRDPWNPILPVVPVLPAPSSTIAFRQATSNTGGFGNKVNMTWLNPTDAGSHLVIQIGVAAGTTITVPGGWTVIATDTIAATVTYYTLASYFAASQSGTTFPMSTPGSWVCVGLEAGTPTVSGYDANVLTSGSGMVITQGPTGTLSNPAELAITFASIVYTGSNQLNDIYTNGYAYAIGNDFTPLQNAVAYLKLSSNAPTSTVTGTVATASWISRIVTFY